MKLALIQFDIAWNNPKENVTRCERLVAEAINQNAEVVVLPEMFTSGFSLPTGALLTECADLGRAFLEHTARTSNITIVGTLPEVTDDGRVFNTAWVFSPRASWVPTERYTSFRSVMRHRRTALGIHC